MKEYLLIWIYDIEKIIIPFTLALWLLFLCWSGKFLSILNIISLHSKIIHEVLYKFKSSRPGEYSSA